MNFKQENEIPINTIGVISSTVLKNKQLCLCCIYEDNLGVRDYYVQIVDVFQGKTITYLRDTKYNCPIITIDELDNGKLVATVLEMTFLLIFDISDLNNIIVDYLDVGVRAKDVIQIRNNEMGVALEEKMIKIYSSDFPYTFLNKITNSFGLIDWLYYMKSKDILFFNSRFRMWSDLIIYDMKTNQKKCHFTKFECFYQNSIIELNENTIVVIQLNEFAVINLSQFTIDNRISFIGRTFGDNLIFHDKTLREFFSYNNNKIIFFMVGCLGVINIEEETIDTYPFSFNKNANGMKKISSNQFVVYNHNKIILYTINE